MIQLQTLGDAVIMVGDREVRPTSPTLFAALLYLGLERGQRVPRVALQELLFPETDERSGAHSLRQLLYKLRQLGASVQAEGDVVWLATEDVSDDYSAPAHNGNGNGNGTGSHGAFLAGYVPKLSPAFDEWLEARRATISVARRRTLIKQMLARRDVSDWISVERIAQEVLVTDPFNGEATYALAESIALSGSKSEAVRILERYESETGNADLKLPASILRKRISERLPDRRRRALDTPFVGRDAEAASMREAIVRLRGGVGGTIVISGEPGIGKTRLLEETSALALLEGVNVHTVRCQPHYVNRPMGVFIEWVPMLMQSRGALGVSPEAMEHLKLLTSHSDDRPNRPTDARDDSTRSGILMAAVRDLVDAVASEAPIFLAVEDAHWADPTSLHDLCTLLERRKSHSLLVAYTSRVVEPLKDVGVLDDSTELLRLKPLVDSSMLGLSQHLLSTVAGYNDQDMDTWCAKTAAGNPFYLQVLCAHYEDTRVPFTVPPGVRAATVRRIEQLPPEARRLLEISAMLGRHASLPIIESLAGLEPRAFIGAVQQLELGGYLRTRDAAAVPSHELLRDCTLELLPPLTRQLLHSSVARELEFRLDSGGDTSLLWDCVDHWAASSSPQNAAPLLWRCACHATDIGQARLAVDLAREGLKYAAASRDRLLLLEQVALASKVSADWGGVLQATTEARNVAGNKVSELNWDWEFRVLEAEWALALDPRNALPRLMHCIDAAEGDSRQRIEAAHFVVKIAHEVANGDIARRAFESVAQLLKPHTKDQCERLLPLLYHTSFGDLGVAAEVADQLLVDLPTFTISDRLRAARNLSVALCTLGDSRRGFDLSAYYYDVSRNLELDVWQSDFASTCCSAALNLDERELAESWYERAGVPRRGISGHIEVVRAAAGLELAIQLGDRQLGELRLQELERLCGRTSPRLQAGIHAFRLRVAHLDPEYVAGDSEIAAIQAVYLSPESAGVGDTLAIACCEALVRRGERASARDLARERLSNHRRDLGQSPITLIAYAREPD